MINDCIFESFLARKGEKFDLFYWVALELEAQDVAFNPLEEEKCCTNFLMIEKAKESGGKEGAQFCRKFFLMHQTCCVENQLEKYFVKVIVAITLET